MKLDWKGCGRMGLDGGIRQDWTRWDWTRLGWIGRGKMRLDAHLQSRARHIFLELDVVPQVLLAFLHLAHVFDACAYSVTEVEQLVVVFSHEALFLIRHLTFFWLAK